MLIQIQLCLSIKTLDMDELGVIPLLWKNTTLSFINNVWIQ